MAKKATDPVPCPEPTDPTPCPVNAQVVGALDWSALLGVLLQVLAELLKKEPKQAVRDHDGHDHGDTAAHIDCAICCGVRSLHSAIHARQCLENCPTPEPMP